MSLRLKLIAALLLVGLATAATVGGVAWWLLMRDFRESAQETAFQNFQGDVANYVAAYGSWEEATRSEPFHAFVMRSRRERRQASAPPRPTDVPRPGHAPFHFLLLDPQGRVLLGAAGYLDGSAAPASVLREARPIRLDGKVVALASPLGDPVLTQQDQAYLANMGQALANGAVVAVVFSLLLGLLFGNRLSANLRELTNAIRAMRLDGSQQPQATVRSRDEIGLLADAFNRMSTELVQTHNELRESSLTVQAQAHELLELSIRDPLTHLYNRRHFDEQAATLYKQAIRHGRPFTVMVGDLDHFKAINDGFSHATGDEVLRRVGCLLLEYTRNSDVAARYGGEEFVIAFAESNAQQSKVRCEEIRARIENYPWQEIHPELKVSMSMGLSDATGLGNVEKMLAQADSRLYQAKHAGRNRVVAG